jgi:hypothetical protein
MVDMAVRGTSDAVQAVPVREILLGVRNVRDTWSGLTAAERSRVPAALRASLLDLVGTVKQYQEHLGDVIPPVAGGGGDIGGESVASQAVLIGTMPDVELVGRDTFPAFVDTTPDVIGGDPVIREQDQVPVPVENPMDRVEEAGPPVAT